jgi:hypothetical protein
MKTTESKGQPQSTSMLTAMIVFNLEHYNERTK